MNLQEFQNEMCRCDVPHVNDWDKIDKCIELSIDKRSISEFPRGHFNLINILSELGELDVALTKYMLGERSINLLEEVADVYCALRYLKQIVGFSDEDIAKAINIKMQRELKRISTDDEKSKLLLYGNINE